MVVVPYCVPVLSPEYFESFASNDGYFPVLAGAIFAILWGVRKLPGPAERRFWGWMAVAMAAMFAISLEYGGHLISAVPGGLDVDLLYLLVYAALFLSVNSSPGHRPTLSGAGRLRLLQVSSAAVFLISVFAYFVLIPISLSPETDTSYVPRFAMYVTFDLFLFASFFNQFRLARRSRARVICGLFTIVTLTWAALDFSELLYFQGSLAFPDPGTPLDLLWYIPILMIGVAARLRHRYLPESEPDGVDQYSTVSALFIYPVVLPALHFGANLTGVSEVATREALDLLVLTSLLVLYGLAFLHQRLVQVMAGRLAADQRALEERLALSKKLEALGGLASGIAHDFNNVLASIMGHGELLRLRASADSRVQHNVDLILDGAEKGKRLVAQILTFSQMRELHRSPVSLAGAVKDSLELLGPTTPANVAIHTRFESDRVFVEAEEIQVHQVVANLIQNACQAVENQGGEVFVEVYPEQASRALAPRQNEDSSRGFAVLSVRDTGPGMTADVCERSFDPFYSTKEVGQGTGLGLAVVHRIVTAHGGTVDVETTPGTGTRFSVRLPLSQETAAEPFPEASTTPKGSRANRRVLVVDDEPAVADLMESILGLHGYEVETYLDPERALTAFRRNPEQFDALVTDQRMPGLTGLQLVESIRRISPDLPVLLVTGNPGSVLGEQAGHATVEDVLAKPFRSADLGRAMEDLFMQKADRPCLNGPEPAMNRQRQT